jgi:hypothetical protein
MAATDDGRESKLMVPILGCMYSTVPGTSASQGRIQGTSRRSLLSYEELNLHAGLCRRYIPLEPVIGFRSVSGNAAEASPENSDIDSINL